MVAVRFVRVVIHEHQNPATGGIKWDKKKVYAWAEETQGWTKDITAKNIIDKYDKSSINGSDFDPLSIMLYFFPAELTTNGVGTKQNLKLSGEDVSWISKTYPRKGFSPEAFYEKTYGESLEESERESEVARKKIDVRKGGWKKTILLSILLLAALIALAAAVRMIVEILRLESGSGR